MQIIRTRQFTLRPLRSGDEGSLVGYLNNKKIYRATLRIPYPYTRKEADKWVKNSVARAKQKNLTDLNFAIVIDGELVGGVRLHKIVKGHKAEVGYWLAEKYWGRGIMTNAVKEVARFGFNKLKLH